VDCSNSASNSYYKNIQEVTMSEESFDDLLARNEMVKQGQLQEIANGGCSHLVYIRTHVGLEGHPNLLEKIAPVVEMANDGDPFYSQVFRNREELEEFIAELRSACDEAWPISKS
jgi:hypothetical protein